MKNLFILILLATVSCMDTQAQMEFKPTIGFNLSDASEDPQSGEVKARFGWQLGASVLSGEKLYWELGAYFVQKSNEISSSTGFVIDDNLNLTGIRLPGTIGIHLLGNEQTFATLRGYGGASLFILTGVDGENVGTNDFTSVTGALFAGAGLDIGILFIDANYEWSLSDLSSLDELDIGQQRSLFLQAGLRIGI